MRLSPRWLLLGVALFTALPLHAQQFEARLSGSAEVLPVTTTGQGLLALDLNGTTLTVAGTFSGLVSDYDASVGMHLHTGRAGENGAVFVALVPVLDADQRGGTLVAATNTFTLSTDQATALQEGRVYVNVHTTAHGSGEIRGQVLRADTETYLAVLSGSNELPANTATAQGTIVAELDGSTLRVSGAFSGLSTPIATRIAGGAHLHVGGAGENGPVAFPLTFSISGDARSATLDAADNTFSLSAEQVAALRARRMYVNVHSTRYPGGEVRGQLAATGRLQMTALLSGSQEVPTVTTTAMGNVLLELDGDTLYASGGFSGLRGALNTAIAGGAHLHTGMAGMNGAVAFALATTAATDGLSGAFDYGSANRFVLSAAQKAALLARGFYANVHTTAHASGELRGQVTPPHVALFVAPLMGMNEVPAVGTPAMGNVLLELDATGRVDASGGFSGLRGALNTAIAGGAHLHTGMAGMNGAVVLPLDVDAAGDGLSGTFPRTAANSFSLNSNGIATMQDRAFYVNVHSTVAAGGEVRGQVVPAASALLRANLSGTAEVPAVTTTGRGMLVGELVGDSLFVSGAFTDLSSDFDANVAGGAHLHTGDLGANGAIAFALTTDVSGDLRSGTYAASANRFALSAAQKAALLARGFYANVHTTAHASGELRGQLHRFADAVLETHLSGQNEVSVIPSPGMGSAVALLTDTTAIVAGGFADLFSPLDPAVRGGAHLHRAGAGANGGIVFELTTASSNSGRNGAFAAAQNTFTLTADQRAALLTGQFYVNVHTLVNGAGEVRGQLLASANFAPAAATLTSPADGASLTLQGGANTAFRAEWDPVGDPNANTVVYRWQLSAASDFSTRLVDARVDANAFKTTYGAVDALLATAGVAAGGSITVYHRVIASDGSVQTVGEASSVTLTRGTLVATEEASSTTAFALRGLYPNPARGQAVVQFDLDQGADVDIVVYDLVGREVVQVRAPGVAPGPARTVEVDTAALAPGTYVYRVTATRAAGTVTDTGTLTVMR